jgi:hypothetical protein
MTTVQVTQEKTIPTEITLKVTAEEAAILKVILGACSIHTPTDRVYDGLAEIEGLPAVSLEVVGGQYPLIRAALVEH